MKRFFQQTSFRKQDIFMIATFFVAALVVFITSPASAQEPDAEAAVAVRTHQYAKEKFSLRPYSQWSVNSPLATPQLIPENSRATTDLMVKVLGDVNSISVAFDYNDGIVSVVDIHPGTVFDGLTEGIDYIVQKTFNRSSPINTNDEMSLPTIWPTNYVNAIAAPKTTASQANVRSYINISIINPNKQAIFQSGSLITIDWEVAAANPGASTFLVFSQIDLRDVSGNPIAPCFGLDAPDPNDLTNFAPAQPPFGNKCLKLGQAEDVYLQSTHLITDPTPFAFDAENAPLTATNIVYEDEPIVGHLQITNRPVGLTFQVVLQGISGSSSKYEDVEAKATQFGYSVIAEPDTDGRVNVPLNPPYETLEVSRDGYLDATGSNLTQDDLFQVTLTAGDVNSDNAINIFDLTIMANALGSSTLDSNSDSIEALERMDYTDNSIIDIADLALVAANFRVFGPTPIP